MLSQLDSSCFFFLVLRSREARSTQLCRENGAMPGISRNEVALDPSTFISAGRHQRDFALIPLACTATAYRWPGRSTPLSVSLASHHPADDAHVRASLGPGSRRGGCRRTYEAIPGSRMATRKGEHVAGQTFMARVDILQADERSEQMLDPLPVPSQLS